MVTESGIGVLSPFVVLADAVIVYCEAPNDARSAVEAKVLAGLATLFFRDSGFVVSHYHYDSFPCHRMTKLCLSLWERCA